MILSLFLLALTDAATTYLIIQTGEGHEANPAWRTFNVSPEAVWTVGLPLTTSPVLLTATLLDFAYMSRLPAAVKIVRYAALAMAVSRAAVVANNAAVLFLHVNLILTNLFFS